MKWTRKMAIALALWQIHSAGWAESLPTFHLILENHLFFPARLEVPADTKFKLVIENRDDSAEEFDSFDLNREKVIFAGRSSVIYIGPLASGRYQFYGEFNSDTARGELVVLPVEIFRQERSGKHVD